MTNLLKLSLFLCVLPAALVLTSIAAGQSGAYQELYRPQVHFSPRMHWTNDPNGLVFFEGEYHLFFQYNPFGDEWGHMSWGHAVSRDLLHWRELAVAIPEHDGEMVFTGSVVVDKNTSGLCGTQVECLVAVYTGHRSTPELTRQTQNLAYSLDHGRTWTRYRRNPVIDLGMADFRDPSVFWDEPLKGWVMAVALPKLHKVRFYTSRDLKRWTELSDFGPAGEVGGVWECPDLLHIPAGDGVGGMWMLKVGLNPGALQGGSGEQYFLGDFDGRHFTPSSEPGWHGWTNYGKDDYCAISFNHLPARAQPVLLGWMNNWQYASKLPTSPWRGQMSLPRRLALLRDKDGLTAKQTPVVAGLREGKPGDPFSGASGSKVPLEAPFEMELNFVPGEEKLFGIRLRTGEQEWTEIGFDREKQQFFMDRTKSGAILAEGFAARTTAPLAPGRPFDLRLVVDRSSIEAYAQDGTIAMTNLIFPPSGHTRVELFSKSGKPVDAKGTSWKLRSIWK
ncbi:MAG TPA: glycoside hydrolase family 32 protein [Terriglobales bacterium]|jgi:sucrose-6-phosphate hydrolase SacC (GH32 family)|nr:glycoside hydrolase family 32 protein [Terriglobales bacterium]